MTKLFRTLLFICLSTLVVYGQTPDQQATAEDLRMDTHLRLKSIQQLIAEKRQQLEEQRQKVEANPTNQEEVQALESQHASLRDLIQEYERTATGGHLISDYGQPDSGDFDWRDELLEISKPLFDNLKDATERPRAIEAQRSLVARLENRLTEIEDALKRLESLEQSETDPTNTQRLEQIHTEWKEHEREIRSNLDIAEHRLEEMLSSDVSLVSMASESAGKFIKGRGMNLLLGVLAGLGVFLVMRMVLLMVRRRAFSREGMQEKLSWRIIHYGFHFGNALLSLTAMMAVFYVSGDWILLGLMLLMLIILATRLKDWLPKFFSELRILLNLGAVREGERVIYKGLPYKVVSINVYSTLENPLLTGGRLRLPLSEMAELISRPDSEEEPWFPCKPGDWLLFDSGLTGKIEIQTPETVHVRGGGTLHIFDTQKLMHAKPMNLSVKSFGVVFTFALDIRHTDLCTGDTLPKAFDQEIRAMFKGRRAGDCLIKTLIEFKEPSLNSLLFLLRLDMDKGIDDDYFHVKRLANAACVEACRKNGWSLAVNQLALHQPPTET